MSWWGMSRLTTATSPPAAKISDLARATPSMPSAKLPLCACDTVVTTATRGRTMRTSGAISLAWFMPIS